MAALRARCLWGLLACGCANPCAISSDDASTGHLSLVDKAGVTAEVDLSTNVSTDFVVNGLPNEFSIEGGIRVAGAKPASASLSIRSIEAYKVIGTFRLAESLSEFLCNLHFHPAGKRSAKSI